MNHLPPSGWRVAQVSDFSPKDGQHLKRDTALQETGHGSPERRTGRQALGPPEEEGQRPGRAGPAPLGGGPQRAGVSGEEGCIARAQREATDRFSGKEGGKLGF